MNPERWQKVEQLFHVLADAPATEREAALAETDPETRAEVLRWLAADAQGTRVGEFVDRALAWLADSHSVPERVGAYRIVRKLGEGGMGVVYLGERDDAEFEKRVAIKMLSSPIATPELRRRFALERQILADLEHPNIARLLDGGTVAQGLPYLVLEYIDGRPIGAFCDEQKLDLRARCRLMLPVCEAVAFAHQNLIVHRDLKPANVLVTDGGVPKLLDFGIAKLMGEEGPGRTLTGEAPLTPAHAAPEQLRSESITTATDVYGLGLILYELVAGRSPFAGLSVAELVHAVCERGAPPLPNTPPDVANIVAKALERDPAARYRSPVDLARDLRNFLDGRPVEARGNAWLYRAGKLARRNWIALTAALAVVASLGTGLWLAARQRDVALRRFGEVRTLARHVIFDLEPEIRNLNGSLPARKKLAETARGYLERLSREAAGDEALETELAEAYERLASITGSSTDGSLGDTGAGIELYRQALRLRESLLERRPGDRQRILSAARTTAELGIELSGISKYAEGRAFIERSTSLLEPLLARDASPLVLREGARSYMRLISSAYHLGDGAGVTRAGVRMAELSRRYAESANSKNAWQFHALGLLILGNSERANANLPRARELLEESAVLLKRHLEHDDSAVALSNRGDVLARLAGIYGEDEIPYLERDDLAEPLFREAQSYYQRLLTREPADGRARLNLGLQQWRHAVVLERLGLLNASIAKFDEAIANLRQVTSTRGGSQEYMTIMLTQSTYPLAAAGRRADADQRLEEVFGRLRKFGLYPGSIRPQTSVDIALRGQAAQEMRAGRVDRGVELLERMNREMKGWDSAEQQLMIAVSRSDFLRRLAEARRAAGRAVDAQAAATERVALWERWDGRIPANEYIQRRIAEARRFRDTFAARNPN